ncbi:MAG: serine/threonine-protein kinase [Pseudomonadota bacterium]|nr:serine/threonine-protein kinase [Pseudomonadota bacterium]
MRLLQEGDRIRDTYEVERLLGEGAFAEVYRVRHRFMGHQALKLFKAPGATIADIERDLAEALLLSAIRHPNIVEVYDANLLETPRGNFGYFTMTYVSGGSLEQYWKSFGSELMLVDQSVEIIRQICRGLAVAHAATPPIVHRDIKPANILVGFDTSGLHTRLTDFGLAKAVNPLTLLATSRGTIGFKPPESLNNVDSRAADIWGVGATLYLLLTDQMPFPSLGQRDTGNANRFLRPLRLPSLYNIRVDSGLESILFRCLAASPQDRYQSAMELLADLDLWEPDTGAQAMLSETQSSKGALSGYTGRDLRAEAASALSEAMHLAKDSMKLMAAADLLEEAMCKDPALHERFVGHLELWRRGIMHCSTAELQSSTSARRIRLGAGGRHESRKP